MTIKKFEFKNTQEEIEIAGEKYSIDFSDDAIIRYNKEFEQFYMKSQDIQSVDVSKLTGPEQANQFNEMRELTKGVTEELLGEGTFEPLYEKSGKSLINMVEVLNFLAEHVSEKLSKLKEKELKKYTGLKAKNVNAHPATRK